MTAGVTVDFNANLARFTTSVEKATADLGKFQSKAESVSAKISSTFQGLAAGLTVGAFTAWIKGSIDAADQMNDLSQRVGIGIKDLAAFELASKQSGTSLESVARGVKGLSGFMVEHNAELKKAGITATDANGAIIQLADLFEALPDGVDKTALSVKLFGKAGMEMIPLLNQGSKGLQEAAEKSKAYGEKLAAMAPNADKFNDQLAELALNSKITGMNIADYLLPGLIGMSQWLNDLKAGGERAETALEFLGEKSWLVRGILKLRGLMADEGGAKGFTGGKNALGLPISQAEKARKDLEAFDAATEAYMKQREAKQRALGLLGKTAKGTESGRDADLERMLKLGQKNLFHSIDSEEEMRLVAEKRAMADAVEEFAGLQRMLKVGEQNELAAYYETAGEEVMRLVAAQQELKSAGKDTFAELTRAVEGWGNAFTDQLADMVMTGKANFGDLANSIIRDLLRMQIKETLTTPLLGWGKEAMSKLFKNADGGAYASASLGAYSNSIVSQPTLFRFASGSSFGLMGEAGAEAILPLARGSNGKLGVQAAGGMEAMRIEVINPPGRPAQVESVTQRIDPAGLVVSVVLGDIARNGPISQGMAGRFGLRGASA